MVQDIAITASYSIHSSVKYERGHCPQGASALVRQDP